MLLAAIANAPKNYSQLSRYSARTDLWRALEATRAAAILAENRHNARAARQQRMTKKTVALLESLQAGGSGGGAVARRPSGGSLGRKAGAGVVHDDGRVRKHVQELKQSLSGKSSAKKERSKEFKPENAVKDAQEEGGQHEDTESELVSDDFSPELGAKADREAENPAEVPAAYRHFLPSNNTTPDNKRQELEQQETPKAISTSATPVGDAAAPVPLSPTTPTTVASHHSHSDSTSNSHNNPFTSKASLQISEQDAQIFARFASSAL